MLRAADDSASASASAVPYSTPLRYRGVAFPFRGLTFARADKPVKIEHKFKFTHMQYQDRSRFP
jgi:hypothetical protein